MIGVAADRGVCALELDPTTGDALLEPFCAQEAARGSPAK